MTTVSDSTTDMGAKMAFTDAVDDRLLGISDLVPGRGLVGLGSVAKAASRASVISGCSPFLAMSGLDMMVGRGLILSNGSSEAKEAGLLLISACKLEIGSFIQPVDVCERDS